MVQEIRDIELPHGLEEIRRGTVTIGGKTLEQLQHELSTRPFRLDRYEEFLINSTRFSNPREPEEIQLIYPRVRDLGLSGYPTIDQITNRGQELGWQRCPAGVGTYLRLQYTDQPLGSVIWVVMEPITDQGGRTDVFALARSGDALWLHDRWVRPDDRWCLDDVLVFSLGK